MIYNLFVIYDGICIIQYGELGVDANLLTGFICAISNFSRETKNGEIRGIEFEGDKKFVLVSYECLDGTSPLIFVVYCGSDDSYLDVKNLLVDLRNEFLGEYSYPVLDFNGNLEVFDAFKEKIDRVVKEYNYSLVYVKPQATAEVQLIFEGKEDEQKGGKMKTVVRRRKERK